MNERDLMRKQKVYMERMIVRMRLDDNNFQDGTRGGKSKIKVKLSCGF